MNVRQKAKRYKKQMELYKKQMELYKYTADILYNLRFQRLYRIEEYCHERAIKNELAWQIGNYLIEHNLVYIESSIDERNEMIKLDCKVEVLKK